MRIATLLNVLQYLQIPVVPLQKICDYIDREEMVEGYNHMKQ